MFFELNGKTYNVKFARIDNMTFAELFKVETNGTLVNTGIDGVSVCSLNDVFEKSKGRKVALADLLNKMGEIFSTIGDYRITKEDRKNVWEIYFRTHKK